MLCSIILNPMNEKTPAHFQGKDAISHVAEAQARGIVSSAEIHGTEIPGHLAAAADAARNSALVLGGIWILCISLELTLSATAAILALFAGAWLIWTTGRSAWLGWSHLERLHRIVAQEKWEIEHHRQQEREELKALYATKGFEGKLLEDVLDVLMADGDRLLRVMVEEELGLSLEVFEHPLKQACGAALGSFAAAALVLFGLWLYPAYGALIGAIFGIGGGAALAAYHEQNRLVPAIIWNIGLGMLSLGFLFFLLEAYLKR